MRERELTKPRDYITVGLVGGPHDGKRVDMPLECPCCGQSTTASGALWMAGDGSIYALNPDLDLEHARYVAGAPA